MQKRDRFDAETKPLRHLDGLFAGSCGQQNDKLLASPAGENVVLAHCAAEVTGNGAESGISRLLCMPVADLLEVVKINEHKRNRRGRARRPYQFFPAVIEESPTVVEASQWIGAR